MLKIPPKCVQVGLTHQAYLLTSRAAQVYQDVESLTVSDLETAQGTELEEVLFELVQHKLVLPENELTRRRFLGSVGKVAAAGVFLTAVALPTPAAAQSATTVTFTTVGTFSHVVPAGSTSVSVTVRGGDGGNGGPVNPGAPRPSPGARGESLSGVFSVTPGETLAITVGERGRNGGTNSGRSGGSGGLGGFGNPTGPDGQPGETASVLGGGGGGGAGGTTSVSGMAFLATAVGGTGGGGQGAGSAAGDSGTFGGVGSPSSSAGTFGDGGNGGLAATGTGNGSRAHGSVELTFS